MRWRGRQQSENIEDVRHQKSPGKAGVAMGGGALALILAVVVMLLGGDPRGLLDAGAGGQTTPTVADLQRDKFEAPLRELVGVVMKDTEDVWNVAFREEFRKNYNEPILKVYRDSTSTGGCGYGSAAAGPFYCPADSKVYIDLTFFAELQQKFGAKGDFPMVYVVGHEVAHHVQNELGFSMRTQQLQRQSSKQEANQLSVRLELQADYLAGVWIHRLQKTKRVLEEGDIEEALYAATRIGDDVLQKQSTGRVRPDMFTHGTAEQRYRWLKRGIESGSLADEDLLAVFDLPYSQL